MDVAGARIDEPAHLQLDRDADAPGRLPGAEDEVPERRGDAVVGARVGEMVVKVMAAQVAAVPTDAAVRVRAAMDDLVGDVHADQRHAEDGAEIQPQGKGGDGGGEGHGDDRHQRLLPRRREVVALAVVARVLVGEGVRPGAPVVAEETVQQVLQQGPGQHPRQRGEHGLHAFLLLQRARSFNRQRGAQGTQAPDEWRTDAAW